MFQIESIFGILTEGRGAATKTSLNICNQPRPDPAEDFIFADVLLRC